MVEHQGTRRGHFIPLHGKELPPLLSFHSRWTGRSHHQYDQSLLPTTKINDNKQNQPAYVWLHHRAVEGLEGAMASSTAAARRIRALEADLSAAEAAAAVAMMMKQQEQQQQRAAGRTASGEQEDGSDEVGGLVGRLGGHAYCSSGPRCCEAGQHACIRSHDVLDHRGAQLSHTFLRFPVQEEDEEGEGWEGSESGGAAANGSSGGGATPAGLPPRPVRTSDTGGMGAPPAALVAKLQRLEMERRAAQVEHGAWVGRGVPVDVDVQAACTRLVDSVLCLLCRPP